MDEEDVYDSLDEHELVDKVVGSKSDKVGKNSSESDFDIASVVPFYGGETLKESIKPSRKVGRIGSNIPMPVFANKQKPNAGNLGHQRKTMSKSKRNSNGVDVDYKEEKSYTAMFYTKIGHPNGNFKRALDDTARAECGDTSHRTDESIATHYSDAQSSMSDSTSFYFKLIEESNNQSKPKNKNSSSRRLSSVASSMDFDMRSVSDISMVQSENTGKSRKSKKRVSLTVPSLGGLGPDMFSNQDKLSRLRMQMTYGQKASTRNRIKMMEVEVLRELKKELKNSNTVNKNSKDIK